MDGNTGTDTNTGKSLRGGALGLGDVFMQAITQTAPATAILFTIPFITSKAGVASPISYLLAFLLVLVLGVNYTDATVEAGRTYYYVATTVDNSRVESSYSNEASVVVPAQ